MTTPARNQVDLHCHTSRSDGVLEPADLYEAARDWGMRLVAITDHDTLDAYRELRAAGLGATAGPAGPALIPAVEINTRSGASGASGTDELHILGFGVDSGDESFESLLAAQRLGRRERHARIVARLRELGLPIEAELERTTPPTVSSPGRPHVARALVHAGYATSVDEAMLRWLVPGAPAYVAREGMTTLEAIEAVRRAGGLAALAHFAEAPSRLGLLRELVAAGLGGLEVHYRFYPAEAVTALARVAAELALVPTGGSDYHGDVLTYAEAQATTAVPLAAGERLLAAIGTTMAPR